MPCSHYERDPLASDLCFNCRDDDGDGVTTCSGDCDDTNTEDGFNTHPGAEERCDNGRNDDCDSQTDEEPCCDDSDHDGDEVSICDGDCNDIDPDLTYDCGVADGGPCVVNCWQNGQLPEGCTCSNTPVIIDVEGDGFDLTGAAQGVDFDLDADGRTERLSWTSRGSDDAWLALDRDGDGAVDDGRELFGNFTAQPEPPAGEQRNGFLALAEFDNPSNGGNNDGVIDGRDAVFSALRLWRDANHDGHSAPGELHALPSLDVARLGLSYKESKRVDGHGNQFRYRAKVDDAKGAKVNRWAWDVFLVRGR